MLFCDLDPTVNVVETVALLPMSRAALQAKGFDEMSGEYYCFDKATVATEGIYVKNRFIVKVESCE